MDAVPTANETNNKASDEWNGMEMTNSKEENHRRSNDGANTKKRTEPNQKKRGARAGLSRREKQKARKEEGKPNSKK
ncbi:hypothetical protein RUM43_008914 [Polyplax serrata]|uniref:Uncharacterized protein n=1 Tax=Polyplax serrata TaxID=468196 RepID=A0AAN8PB61_POLSC